MIGAGKGNHTAAPRMCAGDLDRAFNGFGTRAEQGSLFKAIARSQRIDPLTYRNIGLVRQRGETGVNETAQLPLDRFDDIRVKMPRIEHGNATRKIDVLVTVDIPDAV